MKVTIFTDEPKPRYICKPFIHEIYWQLCDNVDHISLVCTYIFQALNDFVRRFLVVSRGKNNKNLSFPLIDTSKSFKHSLPPNLMLFSLYVHIFIEWHKCPHKPKNDHPSYCLRVKWRSIVNIEFLKISLMRYLLKVHSFTEPSHVSLRHKLRVLFKLRYGLFYPYSCRELIQ